MLSALASLLRARGGRSSSTFLDKEEIALEGLSSAVARLEARLSQRSKRLSAWTSAVCSYGVAGFLLAAALAASAAGASPGTFTPREHLCRVAPLLLEPLAVLAALALVRSLGAATASRDERALMRARARLREAVSDLKDSTRFERTRALLVKFDPETRAAAAREARAALAAEEAERRRRRELEVMQQQQRKRSSGETSTSSKALAVTGAVAGAGGAGINNSNKSGGGGGVVSAALASAGGALLPALDRLAASVVGDNPSLTRALDDARREAAALRGALLRASAAAGELQVENERLRGALSALAAGAASEQQQQQQQLPALTLEEVPESPKVEEEEEEGEEEREKEKEKEAEEVEEEEAAPKKDEGSGSDSEAKETTTTTPTTPTKPLL